MVPITKVVLQAALDAGWKCESLDAIADVIELDRLATERGNSQAEAKFEAMEFPVMVGTLAFRRPSLGGMKWLAKFEGWYEHGGLCDEAMLFMLTHSFSEVRILADAKSAYDAVHQWAETVFEPQAELIRASKIVFGVSPSVSTDFTLRAVRELASRADTTGKQIAELIDSLEKAGQRKSDGDDLPKTIATLLHNFGGTPEYWLWERPYEDVVALLNGFADSQKTEDKPEAVARATAFQDAAASRFGAAVKAFKAKYGLKAQ